LNLFILDRKGRGNIIEVALWGINEIQDFVVSRELSDFIID
jgi:hypothetical protein